VTSDQGLGDQGGFDTGDGSEERCLEVADPSTRPSGQALRPGPQGRPFDRAQGRPFDRAQGRPFDRAQGGVQRAVGGGDPKPPEG
jgi:hypothetical protein